MHIAIMETGRINEAIADQFDRYPEMFRTMFERAGATDLELSTIAVVDGELPAHVDDFDGYLVSGSAAGVYDDFDWIAPLMEFLRSAHAADKPLVGVCFGHQVIAHALGGRTEKWHDGWGLGIYDVTLDGAPSWMPQKEKNCLMEENGPESQCSRVNDPVGSGQNKKEMHRGRLRKE